LLRLQKNKVELDLSELKVENLSLKEEIIRQQGLYYPLIGFGLNRGACSKNADNLYQLYQQKKKKKQKQRLK
jgi:hypothetical protein